MHPALSLPQPLGGSPHSQPRSVMPWLRRPDSLSQRSGYKKGPLTLAGLQVGVGGLAQSTHLQCPLPGPVPSREAAVSNRHPLLGGAVVPLSDSAEGPTEPHGHLGSQPPPSQ